MCRRCSRRAAHRMLQRRARPVPPPERSWRSPAEPPGCQVRGVPHPANWRACLGVQLLCSSSSALIPVR
ncbi:hypothetical protein D3228_10065 [Leucobacter luti]|nr:hypothetical protein [Leucobacter luti]